MVTNLLVTGSHGGDDPHVESKHDALMHAAMLGRGGYILKTRNWTMKPTAKDANNITIPAWDLVVEGRQIYIAAPTDVNIQSGSQGQKRRDLIVARYALNSGTGVETVTLEAIKGVPSSGTPADPGIETGSIIGGAIVSDLPLCRVNLDGITITSIDTLVNVMQPLEDVWDSLTQTQRIRFDRSGTTSANDEMHLSGAILPVSPAIAVISIVWVNKGAFKAQSWKATTLARMVGWKVIGSAVHSPAAENIVYEHLGKNQFAATGSGEIQYITPGTIDIFANAWHRGCLIAPVTPS